MSVKTNVTVPAGSVDTPGMVRRPEAPALCPLTLNRHRRVARRRVSSPAGERGAPPPLGGGQRTAWPANPLDAATLSKLGAVLARHCCGACRTGHRRKRGAV